MPKVFNFAPMEPRTANSKPPNLKPQSPQAQDPKPSAKPVSPSTLKPKPRSPEPQTPKRYAAHRGIPSSEAQDILGSVAATTNRVVLDLRIGFGVKGFRGV